MLPVLIGHTDAFELAVDHTLSAVDTAVHAIFHHIALGSPIEDDQFDGVGGTILDTQAAACAKGWIVGKDAAITLGRSNSFDRI
jgi:hypothetical protein